MPEQHEVRVVLTPLPGYRVKITMVDPRTGRVYDTGMKAGPSQADIDAKVRQMMRQIERAGHRAVC